jgi:hypothetical protein
MATIKNPFGKGVFVHLGSEDEAAEVQRIGMARAVFSTGYARRQGWIDPDEALNPEKLSWEQIIEIRSQSGWKEPEIS